MSGPVHEELTPRMSLATTDKPLFAVYDALLLDLDGVVYLVDQPIDGVDVVLARVRSSGVKTEFVTNNASRRAGAVVELLASLGVASVESEVVTSAQVAAGMLADRLPAGAAVLVVGAQALAEEVAEVGLRPVREAGSDPVAVVQGYGREVGWEQLAEATLALRAGLWWVVTNTDRTLPSPRGLLPGNGALVAALATATDRHPDAVVGKPEPSLWVHAAKRRGVSRPLVVGDRLDTDIAGANRAGMDSLLVLSGVSTAIDLLMAVPEERPSYVAADLAGVLQAHPAVDVLTRDAGGVSGVRCGGWQVHLADGLVTLAGDGEKLDALRALCGVVWRVRQPVELSAVTDAAEHVIGELGLDVLRVSDIHN